jgi:hypothetical protein
MVDYIPQSQVFMYQVVLTIFLWISKAVIIFIQKYGVYAYHVNMNWDQWDRHAYVKTEWGHLRQSFFLGSSESYLKNIKGKYIEHLWDLLDPWRQ